MSDLGDNMSNSSMDDSLAAVNVQQRIQSVWPPASTTSTVIMPGPSEKSSHIASKIATSSNALFTNNNESFEAAASNHRLQTAHSRLKRNRNLLLNDYYFQAPAAVASLDADNIDQQDNTDEFDDKSEFLSSLNHTGSGEAGKSFLSMADTTANTTKNINDTIPFLSQSQMSLLGASGQKCSANMSTCGASFKAAMANTANTSGINQVDYSIQDQLMDSIEEDL